MKLVQAKDYDDMSRKAANLLAAQVVLRPESVLGLATGGTMLGLYGRLIEYYRQGDLDFGQVRTVNLDEYVGLQPTDAQSYAFYMRENLFDGINIRPEATHLPSGIAADVEAECAAYEALIQDLGGIDMQLLGLGPNGHIGFNEPADAFPVATHQIELSESTRQANARFFSRPEDVPTRAITMGIGTIMQARRIVLCVSGPAKAEALRRVMTGPVDPRVPGSVLQLHPQVTVIADREACSLLPNL